MHTTLPELKGLGYLKSCRSLTINSLLFPSKEPPTNPPDHADCTGAARHPGDATLQARAAGALRFGSMIRGSYLEISKKKGPLFGSPYNKDHTRLGSNLGPPILETPMLGPHIRDPVSVWVHIRAELKLGCPVCERPGNI